MAKTIYRTVDPDTYIEDAEQAVQNFVQALGLDEASLLNLGEPATPSPSTQQPKISLTERLADSLARLSARSAGAQKAKPEPAKRPIAPRRRTQATWK